MSNPGNFGLPNRDLPLATGKDGKGNDVSSVITDLWWRLFVRLSQLTAERPLAVQAPGPSPWSFEATTIGHLMVINTTTITSVQLTRGSSTVFCPAVGGFIPMAALDVVTITYPGAAPSVVFIPAARA